MLHLLYCMFYVVSWLLSDPSMRVRSATPAVLYVLCC